jgi:putative polyhydroxyalkanoate system protein
MPKFNATVPHGLGKETARSALEGLLAKVTQKYGDQVTGLEQNWSEDTLIFAFTSYGFKIAGDLVVEDQQVRLQGDLPFAAAMFKGKIESSIQTEIEKALAKAGGGPNSPETTA